MGCLGVIRSGYRSKIKNPENRQLGIGHPGNIPISGAYCDIIMGKTQDLF
jgi:hypothetical protein